MAKFKNIQEALQAINNDAAGRAWLYLEREVPQTAAAIQYLIEQAKWTEEQVLDYFNKLYGPTEEKTRHKIFLIIGALITERDNDTVS